LNIIEQIELAFSGPANPEQEVSVGMFKLRVPAYPVEVVREVLLNAVTHRDYSDPGYVLVRHTVSELVVTSPGGFLSDITPQNILRHEPLTRNPILAAAFLKLGLVEQAGVGRRRIFIPLLSYGKRAPRYETDGARVSLRIFDGGFDEQMAKLVAQWNRDGRDVGLDGLLILSYLKDHAFVDSTTASELLQLSFDDARGILDRLTLPSSDVLERRGKTRAATYHLSKPMAKELIGKAAYTKTRGIDEIRYAEMVRAFVSHHGSITPAECRELLGLGESRSAREQVSRLLRAWSNPEGFLRREGLSKKTTYFPREQ
jgi:ATP-dependent DNA helicase RecG